MGSNPRRTKSATGAPTKVRSTIGLRSGVAVEGTPRGVVLHHPWGAISVQSPLEIRAVLTALSTGALDKLEVVDLVAGGRPFDDVQVIALLAQLDIILRQLPILVAHGLRDEAGTILTVEPISDRADRVEAGPLSAGSILSLDRVAYLRRRPEASGLCLESPLALHRAHLGHAIMPLIARLAAAPIPVEKITGARDVNAMQLLVASGLIHAGPRDEADDERLTTWNFHDLLFHAHSRPGRSDERSGAHFLHRDRMVPMPAIAPARAGPIVDLPMPSFADLVARERSLTEVIESRTSAREYGHQPIAVAQLGELLYRCARTRRVVPVSFPVSYEGADRPYPTGGLAADLELYLSVAHCNGLAPGIYHYESAAHRLRLVNGIEAATPLLSDAKIAAGGTCEPQVLLTITSRFARTAWKYEAIAYSLTLKHVGALLQTLYLVATAMDLAPCALGSGDADRAARAFGLDWLVESSVGEMALGSRSGPTNWTDGFIDLVTEAGKRS